MKLHNEDMMCPSCGYGPPELHPLLAARVTRELGDTVELECRICAAAWLVTHCVELQPQETE